MGPTQSPKFIANILHTPVYFNRQMSVAYFWARYARAAALIVSVLACFSNTAPASAEQHTVRLGLVSFVGEATNIFALDTSLFAKNGLQVEVVRNQAGFQSLQGIMAGEIDIGTVAVTPVVYALLGRYGLGRDFDVVASILSTPELNGIVARSDIGVNDPADLSGKRVGVTLKTASEYVWDLFVLANGIENAEVIDIPVTEMQEAMAAGDLDAAVAWQPFRNMIAAAAPEGSIQFTPGQIYTANWLVVVDREFARQRPEAVEGYLRALKEAEEIKRSDRARVARIFAADTGVTQDAVVELFDVIEFDLELNEALLLNLSLQAKWAVDKDYVPSDITIDMRQWIDASHLRKVKPNAVTLLD